MKKKSIILLCLIVLIHLTFGIMLEPFSFNFWLNLVFGITFVSLLLFLYLKQIINNRVLLAFLSYCFFISNHFVNALFDSPGASLVLPFLFAISFTIFHTLNIVNYKYKIFKTK